MTSSERDKKFNATVTRLSRYTICTALITVVCIFSLVVSLSFGNVTALKLHRLVSKNNLRSSGSKTSVINPPLINIWKAPGENTIPKGKAGEMIRYGQKLIAHTADYFGPKGSVAHLTNGMNCQNCHLDAGTKIFANNFASVTANYPKFSPRSGKVASVSLRIAECFQRSLAGKVPDTAGREVQAMLAYITWLGKDVKKGQKLFGNASQKLPFMNQAANPAKGRDIFVTRCQSCHGKNGEGLLAASKAAYTYPPLWGKDSYNDGAGMYRIANLAGFVKNNMPYGVTYKNPQLTDEEAWDVAAFVNSQPRPHKDNRRDWPKLADKPIDYPFGPFADNFNAKQHKFGPFQAIQNAKKPNR